MSSKHLIIVAGAVVIAMALAAAITIFIWFRIFGKRSTSRTSDTNSSEPSNHAGQNIEMTAREQSPDSRSFGLGELILATRKFQEANLIGKGMFGEVYKGLLPDMVVAIKKRHAAPSMELVQEVRHLSTIRHRNLVSLLGYCQEHDMQILVYEYVPNGSVSSHLYGFNQASAKKLEFKLRLSIAYGAAKGLAHLHSLNPPFVHMDFKTANVLVDENFSPKVADVGLRNLLEKIDGEGVSARSLEDDVFLDPESKGTGRISEKNDVFSFGVFLLELVSGQEAIQFLEFGGVNQWAQDYQDSSNISTFIDPRMITTFTAEGMRAFFKLAVCCLSISSDRPPMSFVVSEIERIHEEETMIMGEGTSVVTLGSQLFQSSSTS